MAKTGVETVERLRSTGTPGRHGERGVEAAVRITGCTLVPQQALEDTFTEATSVVSYMLVMPPRTDLRANDRVRARGRVWEVVGEPGDYRTRRGAARAVVAVIRRVSG